MQIGVLGLNYLTADLQKREALAKFSKWVSEDCFFSTCTVCLSTCNRVEFYFSHEDLLGVKNQLLCFLQSQIDIPIINSLYTHFDAECFQHLARVTSGLDSAVFGETDIQRQVKSAYIESSEKNRLPSPIHYLFQKSLKVGKLLRRNYNKQVQIPDLDSIIADIIDDSFPKGDSLNVSLIGFSEMNRKVLRLLRNQPRLKLSLFTRFPEEAKKLKQEFSCSIFGWDSFDHSLKADVIVSASRRYESILKVNQIENKPSNRPLLIFDLGVPRNVDASVSSLKNVTLLNIDQLDQRVRKEQQIIESEITDLESLLSRNTTRLREIYHQKRRRGLLIDRKTQGIENVFDFPVYVSSF